MRLSSTLVLMLGLNLGLTFSLSLVYGFKAELKLGGNVHFLSPCPAVWTSPDFRLRRQRIKICSSSPKGPACSLHQVTFDLPPLC